MPVLTTAMATETQTPNVGTLQLGGFNVAEDG